MIAVVNKRCRHRLHGELGQRMSHVLHWCAQNAAGPILAISNTPPTFKGTWGTIGKQKPALR